MFCSRCLVKYLIITKKSLEMQKNAVAGVVVRQFAFIPLFIYLGKSPFLCQPKQHKQDLICTYVAVLCSSVEFT